ncbi:MAG: hypothetical protein A2054_05285 [Deltaproteobacteria bacterium GWA2_55_10]|nr:MAG: hypothetical protein A2054_05285 [Deltaproteobacteria bacterium GWA2_55_10]
MKAESGFTLIEVMASMVILGLAIGALLGLISGGLRLASDMKEKTDLVLAAKARLTQAMSSESVMEGAAAGRTREGIEWRLEIVPFGAQDGRPRVFEVAVSAKDPVSGSEFFLTTLRTALEKQ